MTNTFDWAGLAYSTHVRWRDNTDAAAAYLRTRIEAAFVPNRTVELLGECMENLTARAEAAEARVKVLEEALRELQGYGCPVCNGDCGSANPPVISCPMQRISKALGT